MTLYLHVFWCEGQSVILVRGFVEFQSLKAASQRRGRCVHWSKRSKAYKGTGHQTDAESRQGGCNYTWMKLPTRCFHCLLYWFWFGGEEKLKGQILTWGPTSVQRHTDIKKKKKMAPNTIIIIFTWEKRSTWNTVHKISIMVMSLIKSGMSLRLVFVVSVN